MIIYTCLIGDIDELQDPDVIEDHEYICFSDIPRKTNVWRVESLVRKFDSARLTSRYHKVMVASLFKQDTLWQDGKVKNISNVDFISNQQLCLAKHPDRNCIYQESQAVINIGKAPAITVDKLINQYRSENYPELNGLYETSVLFRKNCDENITLNELWWEEINKCIRDQLSLPYVLWKLKYKPDIFNFHIFNNKYFTIKHHPFAFKKDLIKKRIVEFI